MTLYICPTDHVGPLVVPEGTTVARVDNCPNATITRQRLEDAPVAQPPKVVCRGDC